MTTTVIEYQEQGDSGVPDLAGMFPHIAHSLTESSITLYKRSFSQFLDYAREHDLSPADPGTLAAFRDYLIVETTQSPNTINLKIASVKRIMREAYERHLIDGDAAYRFEKLGGASEKLLKQRMKHARSIPITTAQMQHLCNLPDESTLVGLRDKAILFTLATSGMRISELADLRVDRIFPQDGQYTVQVMGKADIEYRSANLSPDAYQLIQEWLSARWKCGVNSEYVFTSFQDFGETPADHKMNAKSLWKVIRGYVVQCGLEHLSPHSFRRYVAQSLTRIDIHVAKVSLGHKSIVTTQKYLPDLLTVGVTDNLVSRVRG